MFHRIQLWRVCPRWHEPNIVRDGLGMPRTRSEFAPAGSMQEPVDAIDRHGMLHFPFKGLLNLLDCSNLSPLGSGKKGQEKGLFLLEGEIFMVASAFC